MRLARLLVPGSLGLAVALAAGIGHAQNVDAIKKRQEILSAMGKATKPVGAMLKGQAPFDLAVVQKALKLYEESAPKLPPLFPDDSKTGKGHEDHETEALPELWANKKDFEERYAKLAADAKAAQSTITDEISFQETFPKVAGNCGGCHKKYRKEQK